MVSGEQIVDYVIKNDGMCIDGEEAWFVDREENILYKWNLKSERCSFIAEIPIQKIGGFRNNPICLKCGDEIFLFPDCGTCIWVYNVAAKDLIEIPVDNPNDKRIGATGCWRDGEIIWAVTLGLKEIWEISIAQKKIIAIYKFFETEEIDCGNAVTRVGNRLYIGGVNKGVLCEFCTSTKEIRYEVIKGLEDGINTVCYDGDQFWLSGKDGRLVGWKRETGEFTNIAIPPDYIETRECGDRVNDAARMLFHQSIYDGCRTWFFPQKLQSSPLICKKILYIDAGCHEVKALALDWQEKAEAGVFSAYVLQGEYMNISSLDANNSFFVELDLTTLDLREKHMVRTYQDICKSIHEKILKRDVLRENAAVELEALIENCGITQEEKAENRHNVGYQIYKNNVY